MTAGTRNAAGTRFPGAAPLAAALAVGLVACVDDAVSPRDRADEPPAGSRALGVVEITISGLGTEWVSSTALSAPTVAELDRLRAARDAAAGGAAAGVGSGPGTPGGTGIGAPGALAPQAFSLPGGDGTIQFELISTGSFTDGPRGGGGQRYLYAIYGVRNARADGTPYDTPRRNLTFYAVEWR